MTDSRKPSAGCGYREIDPEKLVQTARKLSEGVSNEFPGSGLAALADEVAALSRETVCRVTFFVRPNWLLRIGVGFLVLLGVIGPFLFYRLIRFSEEVKSLSEFMEATDAGLHMLLVLGGGVAFLITFESRIRRNRALAAIAEFRSLAHLIDLHQINKDPGIDSKPLADGVQDRRAVKSDEELGRYLDCCCDLLSVVGKLAAFYAQYLRDRVVLDAVNEIEHLTNQLSSKLWLKILIVRDLLNARMGREHSETD